VNTPASQLEVVGLKTSTRIQLKEKEVTSMRYTYIILTVVAATIDLRFVLQNTLSIFALHPFDLLLKLYGFELPFFRLFLMRFMQLLGVALYIFVELLDGALELLPGEGVLSSTHGFEFRAINGQQVTAEEVELTTEEGELRAHIPNGLAVVSAKVGDGLACPGQGSRVSGL
jgi:hypothetical protein